MLASFFKCEHILIHFVFDYSQSQEMFFLMKLELSLREIILSGMWVYISTARLNILLSIAVKYLSKLSGIYHFKISIISSHIQ